MHQTQDTSRRVRMAFALVGAALLALCGTVSSAHAETAAPQLSIAVDNGDTSVKKGDKLSYVITVTNLGTTKVKDLRVSQTIPAGTSFVSADSDGDRSGAKIDWKVDLAATKKVTMRTTMAVASTPDAVLRLATVACAQMSSKGPALVCASDSDQLPAGAEAERAAARADQTSDGMDAYSWWFVGGSSAAVLGALTGVILTRRSRASGARRVVPSEPSGGPDSAA